MVKCCSYFDADPYGGPLICLGDALVNVALLVTSLVFVGGPLMDVCVIQACVSGLSLALCPPLLFGLRRKKRGACLPWLLWTGARIALYFAGPVYLGAVASDGVPRLRGSNGIFFFFVLPFTLGAIYSHFFWVVRVLHERMPKMSNKAALKKAKEARRKKLSNATRKGIVALCIAPQLPDGAMEEAAKRGGGGARGGGVEGPAAREEEEGEETTKV